MSRAFLILTLLDLVLFPQQSPSDTRPQLELIQGEKYFRFQGRPAFVLGRNPAGRNPGEFAEHFRHAAAAGERLVRIHFTYFHPDEKPGEVHPGMLRVWGAILDAAEQNGLAVLPVLGVWADWNDGSGKVVWHAWEKNPYNVSRGGPASRPAELLEDTPCRKLWFQRLEIFVQRWSQRRAIVAWEIFSELDLVTGATEARAVEFTERAAEVIRKADPWKRPVTASQAGILEWPGLIRSPALDLIQIHPYADGKMGGRLDELILSTVRQRLTKYGKPVLIGESGLNSGPPRDTLDPAPRAAIGIRHAIWAATVSGAMNGRALWWQDGYDQFEKASLCRGYDDAAATAAVFVRDVDFTGFAPISCEVTQGLMGGMIGSGKIRLGWFRDARCNPPDWPETPVNGQAVTLEAPNGVWRAKFVDPATGTSVRDGKLSVENGRLRLALPEFQGSIGVQLRVEAGNQ